MSCAVIRTRSPDRSTAPDTTASTCSSLPIVRIGLLRFLYGRVAGKVRKGQYSQRLGRCDLAALDPRHCQPAPLDVRNATASTTATAPPVPGWVMIEFPGMRRAAWLLYFFCVAVYNLSPRYLGTADTFPNIFLPVSVILHGDLDLGRYPTLPGIHDDPPPYYVQRSDSRLVSSFSVVPALLAVPVYIGPILWMKHQGRLAYDRPEFDRDCRRLAKLAASLMTAGSAVFVFLSLAGYVPRGEALVLACGYALGTLAFPVASQGLWGHGPAMLFLSLAAWLWLRYPGRVTSLGAALGMAVACRPAAAAAVAAFGVAVALHMPRRLARLLAAPVALAAALVAYNLSTFGTPVGGYARINADVAARQQVGGVWTPHFLEGLAGLLVSPSRGLLIFSPFLAAGLAGLYVAIRRPAWERFRPLAWAVLAHVALFSSYSVWWGGMGFGPRYLAEILPLLVILIVPVAGSIRVRAPARVALAVLIGASVLLHSLAAAYWTGDWYVFPTNVDIDHARLWDWKDSEITRLLRRPGRP